MMPFLSRLFLLRPRARRFIAIDIGSGAAIRSLAFDCDDRGCIAGEKKIYELPQRKDEAYLIAPSEEYLRRVIFQYLKTAGRIPDEIMIGLGSHLAFNEISAAHKTRPKPEAIIKPAELRGMLDDFLESNGKKIIDGKHFALAHVMPLGIAADGYAINSLSPSTSGRDIEISLFATYALKEFWEALSALKALWGGLKITFISSQTAAASALISEMNVRDALLIKVGAKITEASLIGGGTPLWAGQIEIGGDDFTAAIAERLRIKSADAERLKRQYGKIVLPPSSQEAVKNAIADTSERWLDDLMKMLAGDDVPPMPEKLYIFGGGAELDTLRKILISKPWYQNISIYEKIEVKPLHAEELAGKIFNHTRFPLSGLGETDLAALAIRLSQSLPLAFARDESR